MKHPAVAILVALALWGSTARAQTTSAPSQETTSSPSKFRSTFLPLIVPITEPAVGYGAVGALAFLDQPLGEARAGFGRPDITIAGGAGTENGTWGVLVGDVRHWLHDTLETQAGFTHLSVDLDFHGLGQDSRLNDHPLHYNLETTSSRRAGRFG